MRYYKRSIALSLSLALIIAAIGLFSGVFLFQTDDGAAWQSSQQLMSRPHLEELETVSPGMDEPKLFTFGDEAGQAIFLELINSPADQADAQYTLTSASASDRTQPGYLQERQLVCAGTMLTTGVTENEPTTYSEIVPKFEISWLPFFKDRYQITLWNPSGQYQEYTLTSFDGKSSGGSCLHPVDEDV